MLQETTILSIRVYPQGRVSYTQPALQDWQCVSAKGQYVYLHKHIRSHVDTFQNIPGKSSYSGDVHCLRHLKIIYLHIHKLQKYIYCITHIQNNLRVYPGAHGSIQTEIDKCVKSLGPSHEWSNRSISCIMAEKSPPDRFSLSDFTLFSCLSVVPAGICGPLDIFVNLDFLHLVKSVWDFDLNDSLFECFMHYL